MMNRRILWQTVRALSLDIVAGAVCGGMLAVHATGAAMPLAWWWLLPLAVWVIYTADHLLDATRVGLSAASYQHRFHARHLGPLTLVTILAAGGGVTAAFFGLPTDLFLAGGGLAGLVALYLAACQLSFGGRVASRFPKEPAAGLLYAVGVWFGPMSLADHLSVWEWMAAGLFGLGALLNLLSGSVLDLRDDQEEGHASIAARWNAATVAGGALVLAAVGLVACGLAAWFGPLRLRSTFLVIGLLAAGPALALVRHATTGGDAGFRTWGDLLFLLQALPFVLARLAG